ncbi:cell division protein FtsA [Desulforamulus aeronauticus]|uniref:Cell division protein FtsA n=1 Tax=Desulforamulus aeronauticus DSM 10349 TaxID=1121421 RepID=A0A1M6TN83_9FIRM|nr:cell division FtsA domain-containing protein [Desulforamulus aeronauticus]SHK58349.1 cell division protein FtsA [Desulforamulus aeronauticus DSM 10349]
MAKLFDENNTIFALDIGTRTVIGVVATFSEGNIKLLAQSMVEHQSRAMLNGQIHDIPKVAQAVQRVKEQLEKKLKIKLHQVAIAAAGRSLKTIRYQVEQDTTEELEIDSIVINALELLGVQRAQEMVEQEPTGGGKEKFFCVGHSVVRYYLDDFPINNLEGHRGKKIGAEVLATFLPVSVVNSLHAVLARVGLEQHYLTLEPIAACEVVIPDQLRLLNLALVDVGAGTSDIAIARDGTIAAYGMVPIAGDQITELIVEALMVDFMTAETIKRHLHLGKDIEYQDILGLQVKASCEQILQLIEPALEKLAQEITQHIWELNGQVPPKSVLCVGGGSQIPTLVDRIARKLNLAQQRVVIRNRSNINYLMNNKKKELNGPEGVTVIGIATLSYKKLGQNFVTVTVNGKPFTLFNTKQLSVLQALGLLEFNPRELIGKNGKDVSFTLNGKAKTIFGELAKPARITVNGHPANLQTIIKDGDIIFVEKAVNGRNAVATVADVLSGMMEIDKLDNQKLVCTLNGEPAASNSSLTTGDSLEIVWWNNGETAAVKDFAPAAKQEKRSTPKYTTLEVTVNGQTITMDDKKEYILIDVFNYYDLDIASFNGSVKIKRNGTDAEYTEVLQNGDEIEIS